MPGAFASMIIMLLLTGIALAGIVTFLMARMLLRPNRMTDGKAAYLLKRLSPGDLGMRFDLVRFGVRDEHTGRTLSIAGWWMPHPRRSEKTVVLIHGYADAKVGAIAWAPMWQSLGFNILAIDLRAHGESDGTESTAGYFERDDLNQVLDQFLAERAASDARTLVLFGVSLGAAVALASAAIRESRDIAALVLECPFGDYRNAALEHGRVMKLPAPILQRIAIGLAQWMSGARFDEVRPIDLLARVDCPVMIIESCQDAYVSEDDKRALHQAMNARDSSLKSTYLRIEDAGHVTGICADPESYRSQVEAFLASVVSG